MPITDVLAAVPVSEMGSAHEWYERLLGRSPDAQPMPSLTEWHFPGTGDLQLVEDPDRSGGGLLTLKVDDLHAHVAGLRERNIEVGRVDDTTSDKVLFVTLSDPDGNAISLVEPRR